MPSFRLSKEAEADIRRLYQFGVDHFGLTHADVYLDELFEQLEHIAARPMMFQSVDFIRAGYRRCVFKAHVIYFLPHESGVDIMRILGRQSADTV